MRPPGSSPRSSRALVTTLPDPQAPAPHLDENQGFTAQDLIDQQTRLEAQAHEAIPFRFDACTHSLGYIRQPVVACHSDHELVELFHRHHFRCDCGTPNLYRDRQETRMMRQTGFPDDARPCTLRKATKNRGWDEPNDENSYTHNFHGAFCYCERGKHYDPVTEDEVMYQCIVCEDWLHQSCTALVPNATTSVPLLSAHEFDTLICDRCMKHERADLLRDYACAPGWLVLDDHGVMDMTSKERPSKRIRTSTCRRPTCPLSEWPARFDVFLTPSFRDALCRCPACATQWSAMYPYIYTEEETYDPPADDDDTASATSTSSYERGLSVLSQLPRMQMLESLRAYERLRDALFAHLRPYAQAHEPVTEEAVRAFFREHAGPKHRDRTSSQ
ncbi:RING-type E3 ubiquitin transferase [Malassezia equina]|uniref:RING-type E3 ubiquitin transferase n=1 Tax=Malassezia equina TaxID=1381935 RepID=A0AAF0EE49_9BASI|nr:RING-type E3 ubiquitin transferase [Malassezia equina]